MLINPLVAVTCLATENSRSLRYVRVYFALLFQERKIKKKKRNGERRRHVIQQFVTAHDTFVPRRVPVPANFRFANFSYVRAIKPASRTKSDVAKPSCPPSNPLLARTATRK